MFLCAVVKVSIIGLKGTTFLKKNYETDIDQRI